MKVKIKYSHWYVKMIGMGGFTLYPWIMLAKSKEELQSPKQMANFKKLIKHEMIHVRQVRDTGFILFYIKYIYYNIRELIKLGDFNAAYRAIPYEKEAYEHDHEPLTLDEIDELSGQI